MVVAPHIILPTDDGQGSTATGFALSSATSFAGHFLCPPTWQPRTAGGKSAPVRRGKLRARFYHFYHYFWAMSQQRQNSRKGNFGSSNARVSGRDFRYSWQGLFYRYSSRNWPTRTADFIRGRSTAVLFNFWKLICHLIYEKFVSRYRVSELGPEGFGFPSRPGYSRQSANLLTSLWNTSQQEIEGGLEFPNSV